MNPGDTRVAHQPAKILGYHLERWAVVYVRQSGPQQSQRHPESAEVQAKLRQCAVAWGWPAERIRVLDGDQGRSGTTTEDRVDLAWLKSEIALSHVGLVLGFQFNRLAREDEECCRLINLCDTFDVLVADADGVYHPHNFNDRLLLTLKGFMGSFELHQLQQRMQAGRLNRCQRGEWLGQPPPGYVVGPNSKLQFDPDEQVQQVIRLTLEQFALLGSVSSVLRYLIKQKIAWPFRATGGSERGQLQWHPPHRETLRQMLRNPAYAGTYTWGRYAIDPQRRRTRVERDPQECPVLLRDNHDAYLSWEQYQSNLRRFREQRRRGPRPGPSRTTTATLAGLVVCGHCNCRMQTRYTRHLRYDCQRHALDRGQPQCQSLNGEVLEQLVNGQILEVVQPASVELSRRAAEQIEGERGAVDRQWQLRLERAAQNVDRIYRQYNAVEPENRLVARTLERRWEEALLCERTLREEYERFQQTQPTKLSAAERAQIEALSDTLPGIWQSPQTSIDDKRQVVRLLLQQVTVWSSRSDNQVKVQLHWTGGVVTQHQLKRTVSSWSQLTGLAGLLAQMRASRSAGKTSRQIAEQLNATGQRGPHGKELTAENVRQLLRRTSKDALVPSEKKTHKARKAKKSN
jgi:DNA invertase Pin-like site-specific DNA recombinase